MVENFELIKDYINILNPDFDKDSDSYYVVELIRRGKDNPDLPAANIHFKNYYITKVSDIDKYKDEIKFICDGLKLRAYFSVNKKSFKQVLMDTVAESARRVAVHDYQKPYNIFESCSGKYVADGDKKWVIDIDKEDAEKYGKSIDEIFKLYNNIIYRKCEPFKHIIAKVPTRSGLHLITNPFNVQKFNDELEILGMEGHNEHKHQIIKKNHLTLLYCGF